MGTGAGQTYNRFSATQTLDTEILIVPFFAENPSVGAAKYTRSHGQDIIGVDTGSKTFTVDGDSTDVYKDGETFVVRASDGNDGTYTCDGDSVLLSGDTVITTAESIPDATVCGIIDAGNSGICTVVLQADPNETAGEQTLKNWAKFVITPVIDDSGTNDGTGKVTFQVQFTPLLGGGSSGAAVTHTFTHTETMDDWQEGAGRDRQ